MQRLKFLATLILSSLFLFGQAQNNYSSGWVLLNSGDTIKGSILNKDWAANPKEIKFRKDNIVTYTTNDLKSFGINGESIYQRHSVKYHLIPNDESAKYATNEDLVDSTIVWLKILVSSTISLGENKTNNRLYYYSIKNNIAEELVYGKGIKSFTDQKFANDTRYGTNAVEENLTFRQQLFDLNNSAKGDISSVISTTEYTSPSLTATFNKLNKNEGQAFGKDANSLIIGVGAGLYSHSPSGGAGSYLQDATINSSVTPYIMFGYLMKSSKKSSKISFYLESAFSTMNTTGVQNSLAAGKVDLDIKNTFIELQLLTTYTFNPFDKTKFALGFGIDIMTKISGGNTASIVHSPTYTEVVPNVPIQNNVIASPVFTANVLNGRFTYFVNFQFSKNINRNLNETWPYSRITGGLAYKLKK
ncbi:MAG: hypothetical protein NTZ19_14500 [Bacteroidetes bacterium]|nr:hypothetical protein [Bacteroidota bacterium]